jgi:Methyltransferase domain
MDDFYRGATEFLDIMSRESWRQLGPWVVEALAAAAPAAGPVVDVGAGSGLGTLTIAKALPQAEILAVEPVAGLRAVLLSRVYDSPDLVRRVTVLDADFQHAVLPDGVGAVVAMNMIGHLDHDDRRTLWAMLARRLAPGAPIVLNIAPPGSATMVHDTRFCEVPVGRRTYESWGRAEPHADSVTWHLRYRVLEGGALVDERAVDYLWWNITEDDLRAEVAEHGLTARSVGATVYAVAKRV